MTDTSRPLERGGRRGGRRLSPVQKYEAFVQVLTGEMTVVECADHWGVDRSTIMRAREVPQDVAHPSYGPRSLQDLPYLFATRHANIHILRVQSQSVAGVEPQLIEVRSR